jgi:ketosteroid isomerase-like protein
MRQDRPLMDTIEVRAPTAAALAVRVLLRLPAPLRRRVLVDAFTRAQNAFNRGDFEAIVGPWADDVEYVPPPALHTGEPIRGRAAVLRFWHDIANQYPQNRIANLTIEEATPTLFVRTARLSHERPGESLEYVIRQTTELRHGRVIRQVNEQARSDQATAQTKCPARAGER